MTEKNHRTLSGSEPRFETEILRIEARFKLKSLLQRRITFDTSVSTQRIYCVPLKRDQLVNAHREIVAVCFGKKKHTKHVNTLCVACGISEYLSW